MTGRRPSQDPDRLAVLLLGAALVVLAVLVGQSLATLRAHANVVHATLQDYASFASRSIARELDAHFTALFLDQIAVSREAHAAWAAGLPDEPGEGRRRFPRGAIEVHFSIDGDSLVTRGGPADPATRAWISNTVPPHARGVYPAPAPYAVLRAGAPDPRRVIVYRRETYYDEIRVFGFVVDLVDFGEELGRIVRATPTLPRSLETLVEPAEVLGIRLATPGRATVLELPVDTSSETVSATTIAAKAGRMAVTATLDAERAARLVPGGAAPLGLPLFAAMALGTVALFAAALALTHRAARLTRMREAFVANVSHDLRTPLAQIRMFTETLRLGRLPDPSERDRALAIVEREATRLGELVENMMHAARNERPVLRPVRTDLAALVSETVEALGPAAAEADSVIRAEVMGAACARVDPAVLRRILVNLLDNALKHGARPQTVRALVDHAHGMVRVVVSDEGAGVPRRERGRVWDRFTRLRRDSHVTGTGLGLTVVRDLAHRHGGGVFFDDADGGGARVTATIAVDVAEAPHGS